MPKICLTSIVMAFLGIFLAVGAVSAVEAPRITKEQLKPMIGDPNVVIVDVRTDHDWADSGSMIKGAVRENPAQEREWANKYPKDKTIIFY
jgi:rhodanese-related sulfurtransferase